VEITDPKEREALEKEFEALNAGLDEPEHKSEHPPVRQAVLDVTVPTPKAGGPVLPIPPEIPNALLLAELQLLRKEMQAMREEHQEQMRILKSLVVSLTTTRSV